MKKSVWWLHRFTSFNGILNCLASLAKSRIREAMEEMADVAPQVIWKIESDLPAEFPESIHVAVRKGLFARLNHLKDKRRMK